MILLLPGNPAGHVGRWAQGSETDLVGWLITPRQPMKRYAGDFLAHYAWAADNECYTLGDRFDFERYLAFLWKVRDYPGRCLFVTVPDVVGDAQATAECWRNYAPAMRRTGLPLAYVAQDGLDYLPCGDYAALFIGGSTEYKLSQTVVGLCQQAKQSGLWVHMGRVNSIVRMRHAAAAGVDSVDGTGWAKRPLRYLRWALAELRRQQAQIPLGV